LQIVERLPPLGRLTLDDLGCGQPTRGSDICGTLAVMSWAALAQGQQGAISRRQLRAHGLASDVINRMLARGELTAHERGVFVPRSALARRDGLVVTARAWTLLDHLGAPDGSGRVPPGRPRAVATGRRPNPNASYIESCDEPASGAGRVTTRSGWAAR
jgi:hypothetical protein